MDNDPNLMAFNLWRADRPVYEGKIVKGRNDHASRTVTVWWAGDGGDELFRLRAEARRRNIELIVLSARYKPNELNRAAHAVFDASGALADLGFELHSVTTDPEPEGLLIEGAEAARPDGDDADPLPTELVRVVRELVATLQGIDGVLAPTDIHIELGRVHIL